MGIYQFKNLSNSENVLHGISAREFGTMKNEDGSVNRESLKNFLEKLEIGENAACMGQVHGNNVEVVTDLENLLIPNTDGLITNQKNIPLCVLTADCLPVLFFEKKKNVIGVAHCGYKGLNAGILNSMLTKLKHDFSCDPKDIVVGVGPGIEKKCYEVEGKMVDIRAIANDQLLSAGIKKENIENMNICTKCNGDKLYSYRGGDKLDRFVSMVTLI